MREKGPKILPHLVVLSLIAGSGWPGAAWPQETALPEGPPELIVLLAPASSGAPSPEAVVEQARRGHPLPANLAVGSPQKVELALRHRARGRTRELIEADPDSPLARLERYLILSYPKGADLDAIQAALEINPDVLHVERNYLFKFHVSPSDPLFPVGATPANYQWGSHLLNLPAAWDYAKGHSYVGLLDTGLERLHEDLAAFDQGGSYLGGNFREHLSFDFGDGDTNVDEVQGATVPNAGHGTHVAGIVAATTNNRRAGSNEPIGAAGTCWSCSVLMAKVVDGQKVFSLSSVKLANALEFLADNGAQLVSMSLGRSLGGCTAGSCPIDLCQEGTGNLSMFCTAMELAERRDLTLFASSGNSLEDIQFPASDPRVIAVGGVEPGGAFWDRRDDEGCPFAGLGECGSNYTVTPGRKRQDLVAPASKVLSTFYSGREWNAFGCGDSLHPEPGYGLCTGTSMSSPFAAGVGGLLRAVNPLLTKAQVRDLLISNSSRATNWDPKLGYGYPDAAASVHDALGRSGGTVLNNRLTPLFSLYSSIAEDHFYTTFPQMGAAAIWDATGYFVVGPDVPGYGYFPDAGCNLSPCSPEPGASVYLLTTDRSPNGSPLVPLYRMSFQGATATNPNNRDTTYTTEAPGILAFKAVGYDLDGVEGYIYKKCTPEPSCIPLGAVKLLRRYNSQRDDFAIFPDTELAAMEAAGYTSLGGGNLSGYLGYVYPNVDADGDTLINGFETILGTSITQPDTDCDGLTDGHEVLTFPYGDPRGAPGCQPLNAQFLAQTVPTTMVAGQTYTVSLTVKNTGTQTWSPVGPGCHAFRLGSANPPNNNTWGLTRAELPSTVAPGGQVTVTFTVTAPGTPGSFNFQWQMVKECVTWFGPLSPSALVTVQNTPPTARFAFTCSGLSCSFDGSTSTDNTGISSYAWNFSDPPSGSGVTASHTFTVTGSYTVTLTVTDLQGSQSSTSKKVSVINVPPLPAESYFAVAPCRLLDTRSGPPLNGNQWHVFNVAGSCGIPATAKAVSFNVGVVSATAQGWLIFSPGDQSFGPFQHSTLNFVPSPESRFNNAVLRLATNGAGTLAVWPAAAPQLHLLLDVYGYFSEDSTPAPGATGPLGFQTLAPCRVLDTRSTSALTQGVSRSFALQGVCGVPAGAPVAAVNLTAVYPSDAGNVRIFPSDAVATLPTLQFPAGTFAQANGARTPLASSAPDARVLFSSSNPGATAHAIVDAYGYFKSGAPLRYRPITPCRLLDTRLADQGAPAFARAETRNIQVQGNCGVPLGAKAAVLNVTSVSPGGVGWLILYPSGTPSPLFSAMNFSPAQGYAVANGVTVALSSQPNDLAVTCAESTSHVVIDVFGYFQ